MFKLKGAIFLILILCFLSISTVSAANWTVNPGNSIQGVIDNASDDDIVIVNDNNGTAYTYTENLVINKTLHLRAKPGGNVTVQALNSSKNVFTVNSGGSGSTLEGFIIMGATAVNSCGIYLDFADNCLIAENTVINNWRGIEIANTNGTLVSGNTIMNNAHDGLRLDFSNIITVSGNNVTNNGWNGILLAYATNNTISENTVTGNGNNGIYSNNSNNSTISGNDITSNLNDGIYLYCSSANINFNRIFGNSRYGLYNDGDGTVNATNNWWGSNNPIVSSSIGSDICIAGGTVIYDPWLLLSLTDSIIHVTHNSTSDSEITADLTHNNHGEDTSSSGTLPDGIPVNFTTTLGTISGPATTRRGKVVATLTSSTNSGAATVSATLDNHTVSRTFHNAFNSIQLAINDPLTLNGTIVEIENGTYVENIVVNKNITLRSVQGGNVIFQAANSSSSIVTVNSGLNIIILGITFINSNNGAGAGGAIYNQGNLTVAGCTFTNNTAKWGGAICNSGTLTVTGSTFTGNTATWDGGAINSGSVLTVNDCIFINNTAQHVCGAIINWQGTMNITNSSFTGNSAAMEGGAIGNYYGSANINFNRIVGNGNCGLYNGRSGVVNATNNWWGSNNGPVVSSTAPSDICIVSGTVTYNSWLVLSVTSTLDEIYGSEAVLTADLTHNNNGDDTSSQGHVPDGIPVNFATNQGNITSPAYTRDGKATTILSNLQSGTANITATLDNQSVYTQVTKQVAQALLNITADVLILGSYPPQAGLNISQQINLTDPVTWVSVVYRHVDEPGVYEVDIIVNGNTVLTKHFINFYSFWGYDQEFWWFEVDSAVMWAELNTEGFMGYARRLNFAEQNGQNLDSILQQMYNDPNLSDADMYLAYYHRDLLVDNIQTTLTYPGGSLTKTETITYINGPDAGFEIIQSFAIVTDKVTDDMVQYWLNQNYTYPAGHMKAAYGTFMTALTTLWLSDKLADEMGSCLNVKWVRTVPTVVMSGVTGGKAYVSCLDPAMGMSVIGDADNVLFFRFVNSLMLSEIENGVLNSTGLQVKSTVSTIISRILNGESFLFVFDEEANRLTLMLEGDEKFYIIIDLETGLVLDIVEENDSLYKGATSSDTAYCFHDGRTDGVCNFVGSLLNDFGNGLKDPHTALSTIGGIALLGACVASGPVGWLLLGTGLLLCAGGSGLLDDISGPNPGYKNPYNWADFVFSVALSRFGAPGAKSAAGPIIKNMGKKLAVSNVPIEGTLNPARISYLMKFGNYEIMTSNQRIVRGALGRTESEKVLKFSKDYTINAGFSVFKDHAPPLPA